VLGDSSGAAGAGALGGGIVAVLISGFIEFAVTAEVVGKVLVSEVDVAET